MKNMRKNNRIHSKKSNEWFCLSTLRPGQKVPPETKLLIAYNRGAKCRVNVGTPAYTKHSFTTLQMAGTVSQQSPDKLTKFSGSECCFTCSTKAGGLMSMNCVALP